MQKTNTVDFEILEDGTISITTGDLQGTNHVSADKMLSQLFEMVGGPVQSRKRSRLEVGHAIHEHHHTHQH